MIVLDASAVLELLLRTPTGANVERRIAAPRESLHVPHLLDVEVAQVVRRYERRRAITAARGREMLEDLSDLDATRYPHDVLLRRIWDLRQNLTAYDAVYVALAEALAAPLLTCDASFAGAHGHAAKIEHLTA
ncbi:MAG TPA: type II toxin-antitoxin system VapC family toxin [Polyangiaceae bacterium]|jgi:predicted nucleic acid-binding protein